MMNLQKAIKYGESMSRNIASKTGYTQIFYCHHLYLSTNSLKSPLIRRLSGFIFPEMYSQHSNVSVRATTFLLNKYKHLINCPKNPSILEFGFGDGGNFQKSLLPLLPSDYVEYVATDISEKMLEYAKTKIKDPRFKFVKMDAGSKNILTNFENRFDFIFSFFVNHFVDNPQMFRNAYKMLKPGGQIFQIAFERSNADIVRYNLSKHPKWGKYGHEKIISHYYFETSPKDCATRDLHLAGFKKVQLRVENLVYEFADDKEWQGLYLSTNPIVATIPPEELDEYKECYLNEVRKNSIMIDDTKYAKMKVVLHIINAAKDL